MADFIGRKSYLAELEALREKKKASLVVLKGRRRIGKSRLIEEFGRNETAYFFVGLPPTPETTAADQRAYFSKRLQHYFGVPIKSDDWWDLLTFLAKQVQHEKVIISLDEISWIGSLDPSFLGKLKTIWDTEFKKNNHLIMVLCGSVSVWIEENILSNTGFFGRISLVLTLTELSLTECSAFWRNTPAISAYEKFKLLAVTGGVPRYLEEVLPKLPAEENLRRLCFLKSGILFNEFDQIFSDLFSKRSDIYKNIVVALMDGPEAIDDIANKLSIQRSGVLSKHLDDLVQAGFLKRDFDWHLKDGKPSKLSRYRLSDNYLRFYLKMILPNKEKIESGLFNERSLTALPAWRTMMGFQFENLILNNRSEVRRLLNVTADSIVADGAYFQRKTNRQAGCQIDYLLQTRHDTLYVCEVKFLKEPIKEDIIEEVKDKIKRLTRPRYMSCRPVLIHVNGVSDAVLEADYFSNIIDFSELLNRGVDYKKAKDAFF